MNKNKIDCLLTHVPNNLKGDYGTIMIMPMGLFALADNLVKNKYKSYIVHLGVEKIRNPNFDIAEYIRSKDIKAIGFSLHWAQQSSDTIEAVNQIKSACPDIKIILGGFTAGYFAHEIMDKFKNVDFVIKGDAELPLLRLIENLSNNKKNFDTIPNLIWRENNQIIHNKKQYVAANEDLNQLNFTNFKLMKNFSIYKKLSSTGKHKFVSQNPDSSLTFPLFVGRGCLVNCSFCGGARLTQKIINNRSNVVYRAPEKVVESIKEVIKAGFRQIYICADSLPGNYYQDLFRLVREANLKIKLKFGSWSLPTKDFIDEFKKTFAEGSSLEISPETGSERIRKLNKGIFYTNKELCSTLAYLKKRNIPADIFFGYPLPFSNLEDLEKTEKLIKLIKEKYFYLNSVFMHRFSFDPGCPMYENPKKYKITKKINSFTDFVNFYKNQRGETYRLTNSSKNMVKRIKDYEKEEIKTIWASVKNPVYSQQSTPTLYKNIYKKKIGKFLSLYNPYSTKGLIITDSKMEPLIRVIDGKKKIKDYFPVINKIGVDRNYFFFFINNLYNHDLINFENKTAYFKKYTMADKTLILWVYLTNQCNFRCTYCYVDKTRKKMDETVIGQLVSKLLVLQKQYKFEKIKLHLAGGEPLLEFGLIKKIVGKVKSIDKNQKIFDIGIVTNASLLTDTMAEYFKANKIAVIVSMDGIGIYNDLTRKFPGGSGTFQHVKRGIDIALKYKILKGIGATITAKNTAGLSELTKFCLKNNVKVILQFYKKINQFCQEDLITGYKKVVESYRNVLEIIYHYYEQNNINHSPLIDHDYFELRNIRLSLSEFKCLAGSSYFSISPDGAVESCPSSPLTLANIRDRDFISTARHTVKPTLDKVSVEKIKECNECLWKYICGGGCMLERIYLNSNGPAYKCKIYKALIPMILKFEAKRMIRMTLKKIST